MARLPCRGLVSQGLLTYVRLPEVLSPHVSQSLFPIVPPACVPVVDGASASPRSWTISFWRMRPPSHCLVSCLPLSPIVSHCFPASCVPVLDGASAFPRHCPPLSPHMCACVGWGVHLPGVLSPLLSYCLPTCVPVLDGASALPRSCLRLSPIGSPHVRLCWMVCQPSGVLPPLVYHRLVPACLPPCLPACLSSCFPLWRVVSFCIFSKSQTVYIPLAILNAFSYDGTCFSNHFLNPPTVWGLRRDPIANFLTKSACKAAGCAPSPNRRSRPGLRARAFQGRTYSPRRARG